ncbi:TATA-box binding protein [Anoxybacillus vitaminiphilus]|uniref:TATA-box binding protein n=1 Tax=Paranoxybacillus vitaminiphilus TaxID=581036 RepID=A0A327YHM5_9BACL|nr:YwmB family TATA-box binding protein [Anoxybacillus vitaminiphilus]RAK20423.1 TATA-box binding protein [Anoxybacillus vitaminiphilus]
MKPIKMIIIVLMLSAIAIMHQYSLGKAKGKEPFTEIKTMARVLQQNGAKIEEWVIYTREYSQTVKDHATFLHKANELKEKHHQFQWTVKKDNDIWKATGLYEHSSVKETIQLVMTVTNKKPQTYILYEAKGFGWSDANSKAILEEIKQNLSKIFVKEPSLFSCVKGEFSDKMKGVLFNKANHFLAEFQAKPFEALQEETFVSISAYTELWGNALPGKNQLMNIQLALRNTGLGEKTTIVVGTPIITIEY